MQTAEPANRRLTFSLLGQNLCSLLVGCTLLIPTAYCWATQAGHGTTQGQAPDLVEALKRDSTGADDGDVKLPSDLESIAKKHDVQAIPVLEEIFNQRRKQTLGVSALLSKIPPPPHHVEDSYESEELNWENELHIASVLIRLGVKDDVYWDYLAEQTRTSLEINIPFPLKTDAQEDPNPPMDPKFITWAKSRNRDQNMTFMFELSVLPSPVTFLAVTNDSSWYPPASASPRFHKSSNSHYRRQGSRTTARQGISPIDHRRVQKNLRFGTHRTR